MSISTATITSPRQLVDFIEDVCQILIDYSQEMDYMDLEEQFLVMLDNGILMACDDFEAAWIPAGVARMYAARSIRDELRHIGF